VPLEAAILIDDGVLWLMARGLSDSDLGRGGIWRRRSRKETASRRTLVVVALRRPLNVAHSNQCRTDTEQTQLSKTERRNTSTT
jgi:hypothetical protein